jgi:hypothetical protein
MNRPTSIRLIGTTALCLVAIGFGTALHLPALAAAEYQQFVLPMAPSVCASTTACLQWTNSKSGAGIEGISNKGNGGVGQTTSNSTTKSNGKTGVLGKDNSTSGTFDSGVLGTSTRGTGVQGTSVSGSGVVATSSGGSAFFAENTGFGDGAQVLSLNNDGTNTSTQNPSNSNGFGRSGLWGHDDSTDGGTLNYGVAGSSTSGTGVFGSSSSWVGVEAIGGMININTLQDWPALSATANTFGGEPIIDVFDGCENSNPCTSSNYVARIDGFGDMFLTGLLRTSGSCSSGCAKVAGQAGRRVVSYAPRETQPTMEDVGEAQLVGGRAYVRLEAKYATVVDRTSRYFVFITPEGDCDQLYVTGKSADGFTVREARNGSSTVPFQYRIVARPYGDGSPRLPDVQMRAAHRSDGVHAR